MKIAFVTNLCPHYRIKTFELMARRFDIDFYFFSAGDDWYYQQEHDVHAGQFRFRGLSGFHLGRTRITPGLLLALLHGDYDVYIKCINGRFVLPVTYLAARVRRKPFILWTGIWVRLGTIAHRAFFSMTRFIYTHSDAVVTYGEHVKQYLSSEGVEPSRVFVASHAVDNDLYSRDIPEAEKKSLRRELSLDPGSTVILFMGRLEEEKGLPYLVDAFAELDKQDAVLVLAGTGSRMRELQARADRQGILDRVRFPGYVSPESTPVYFNVASALALPSISLPIGKEPWGLVVNEAMNQGTPVIVTDAVGAAAGGLVRNGVNGFVVPERDTGTLVTALRRIACEHDLREKLGANARKTVADWTNERMVDGFERAIEYACSNRQQ